MKMPIVGCASLLVISAIYSVTVVLAAEEGGGPPVLAKTMAPAREGTRMTITSSAFVGGGSIPDADTQNGENMSPELSWTKGPQGTRSYVLLAEDSGVNRKEPIVHWVMYDIDPSTTRLARGIPTEAKLDSGANQGKNIAGKVGYIGPKPPAGQTHPYHFEIFALNTKLNLDPTKADRDAVVAAMRGKVLAEGDLIGNYTGK